MAVIKTSGPRFHKHSNLRDGEQSLESEAAFVSPPPPPSGSQWDDTSLFLHKPTAASWRLGNRPGGLPPSVDSLIRLPWNVTSWRTSGPVCQLGPVWSELVLKRRLKVLKCIKCPQIDPMIIDRLANSFGILGENRRGSFPQF